MSDSLLTLLDLVKLSRNDAVVGLIEAVTGVAPEVDRLPARTIKGTSYTTVARTALPTVSFRAINEGVDASKSKFEQKLVQCFVLGSRIVVDRALAESFEDGAAALQSIEAVGVMESAKIELGKQIFYGVAEDAKGFPGLQSIVPSTMTVDAGGTTATTGSSVYAVRLGVQDIQLVFGNGTTFTLGDWRDGDGEDAAGKKFPAHIADLSAWVGLQCTNPYAVGRLKDATADSGKGVTDAQLQTLLDTFPVGKAPSVFFMNRRSAGQLQRSRTVVINSSRGSKAGGDIEAVAEYPTSAFGIPIVVTDSLVSTETLS
jgi:hypothetical protein